MKLLEGELFQIYDRYLMSVVGVCRILQDCDIDAVYQMWCKDLAVKHDSKEIGSVRSFCAWGIKEKLLEHVPVVRFHFQDGHILSDGEIAMLWREKTLNSMKEEKQS